MSTVNSVLGPIDTSTLGFTLMHEHIFIASAGVTQNYPELLGNEYVDHIVTGLKQAKDGGIDTIVDATTFDMGRDVSLLAQVSRRSGVNIIACTGWYLDIPRFLGSLSADQFAQIFVKDIREGISGTNIKAGIIKEASDIWGVTEEGETILRAVARAHLATGAPIMLHSYSPGQVGKQQLAILKEEGVALRKVKVDHSNDTTDVEYLIWLLEQGCYLGMDRYPGRVVSSTARTRTMKELMDAGYTDRLLPSHDWSLARIMPDISHMSPEERQKKAQSLRVALMTPEERNAYNPHGFLYVKKVVFPQLLEMGVTRAALERLCIDGPRNFFEGG